MNSRSAMHWIALGVNVATVNAVLLFLLRSSGWRIGTSAEEVVGRLFFGAWALSPYGPLLLVCAAYLWWRIHDLGPCVVNLVGTIVVCGFGLFVYIDVFVIHLDAQSAIAFVTVPVLQGIGVFTTLVLQLALYFFVTNRRRRL